MTRYGGSASRLIFAVAGVHIRCFYYSTAVLDDPSAVRPIFMEGLPLAQKDRFATSMGKDCIVDDQGHGPWARAGRTISGEGRS